MSNGIKKCCTCLVEKPFEDFNKYSQSKDGRQPRCRECQRIKRISWYEANRETVLAKSRAWCLANPEKVREKNRNRKYDPEAKRRSNQASRQRHGHKYRAREKAKRDANIEEYRERERVWRAKNAESVAARKRRYRETNPNVRLIEVANANRRIAVAGSYRPPIESIRARLEYYGNKCWMCGGEAGSVDHVKPLAKGGSHLAANLRPACIPCNMRKHARWWGVSRLQELAEFASVHAAGDEH